MYTARCLVLILSWQSSGLEPKFSPWLGKSELAGSDVHPMLAGWFPPIVCQDIKIIMNGCASCVKRAIERLIVPLVWHSASDSQGEAYYIITTT